MSRWNRLNRIAKDRLPTLKRTMPCPGEGEDKGRYFWCWYCKLRNDAERRQVGDGSGIVVIESAAKAYDGQIMMDSPFIPGLATKLFSDGTIDYGKTNFISQVVSGCSFCGSMNYR